MRTPAHLRTHRTIRSTLLLSLLLLATSALPALAAGDWNSGVAAYKAGEFDRAIEEFKGYVEARPDVYQGHQMLGVVYLKAGRSDLAATHLARAVELAPEDATSGLKLLLGRAYVAAEDPENACRALEGLDADALDETSATTLLQLRASAECGADRLTDLEQLARNRDDVDTWAAYARAALAGEDFERARVAADRAAELAPEDARVLRLQARVMTVTADSLPAGERSALLDAALVPARSAYEIAGDFRSALTYADALIAVESYEDAVDPLRVAIAAEPDEWLPVYTLASVQAELGRIDEAIGAFERALHLAQDDADRTRIRARMGSVLESEGRYAAAAAVYDLAGLSEDAERARTNAEIAAENAEADEFNRRREELLRDKKAAEEELRRIREGEPPPFA